MSSAAVTQTRQQQMGALRAAEDALAARVSELIVALRVEVEGYCGYPPEQLDELIRQQAEAAEAERRAAALTLLQQVCQLFCAVILKSIKIRVLKYCGAN